jgi:hypothetical protein
MKGWLTKREKEIENDTMEEETKNTVTEKST